MINQRRWDTPQYQRITSVTVNNDNVVVLFENGDEVKLATEQISSPGILNPVWDQIQFNPYEIVVPTSNREYVIPWNTIRLLADNEFAIHEAQVSEQQSQDIGTRIRDIRRRKGLSSKDVALRAGLSPQSLSRIERGHHDVVFVTLNKILTAMGATLADLADVESSPEDLNALTKRLESFGLKREWVNSRMLPERLLRIQDATTVLDKAAEIIGRVFGWTTEEILSDSPLDFNPLISNAARFKSVKRIPKAQQVAYANYAYYLSKTVVNAMTEPEEGEIPSEPDKLRQEIVRNFGSLTFEAVLKFVWDRGIAVVPLNDSGAFHGACWLIDGRKVIVLKQKTPYQSRWLHDLIHELLHCLRHLDGPEGFYLESEEILPFRPEESEEEIEANDYAADVLLSGQAERLTELAVTKAKGKVEFLKSAVIDISIKEEVPVDTLANYIAWRLSLQGINWWGAANNLQVSDPLPLVTARQMLFDRIDLSRLNDLDRELLQLAFTERS